MDRTCFKCGVALEAGSLRAREGPMTIALAKDFSFVRSGTPTSANPIKAFQQGMAGEATDEAFPLTAWRCPKCGFVELCATRE